MNKKHLIGYPALAILCLGAGGAAAGSGDAPATGSAPTATVTVPGASVTVPAGATTITAPPVTRTVSVPGPVKTVTAAPPPPAAAMAGDGVYEVGVDVKSGTYVSKASDSGNCYWARLKNNGGGFDAIIANGNSSGQVVVTIRKTDQSFESNGCSDWVRR